MFGYSFILSVCRRRARHEKIDSTDQNFFVAASVNDIRESKAALAAASLQGLNSPVRSTPTVCEFDCNQSADSCFLVVGCDRLFVSRHVMHVETVLHLPLESKTPIEVAAQKRVEFIG
jgi:hypothetical protein